MEVNFRGGGNSLGVVAGAATHVSQMKSIFLIGGDCPCLFTKEANRVSRLHNRFPFVILIGW